MWIFTNTAFISAVAYRDYPDRLMIRARLRGDLEKFFAQMAPPVEVTETCHADYRYRTVVTRTDFESAIARAAQAIDYPNFKSSIAHAEHERHDAYIDVWSAMHRAQNRELQR